MNEFRMIALETKDLLVQRGPFKWRDQNLNTNRSKYSKVNKMVKKSSKTTKTGRLD